MRLTAPVYRAHHPRWGFQPSSGEGAAIAGGRFNPIGMPALYTSTRIETAWLEAQQSFAFKAQPMTLCAYDVNCDDILDLTSQEIRAEHQIALEELACPWKDFATRGLRPASWALTKNCTPRKSPALSYRVSRVAPAPMMSMLYFGSGAANAHTKSES